VITRFSTLYAGHVDLENQGFAGTPVNARRYSNEQLATVFETAEAIAATCDRAGLHTLWLAEHHFQREGYECLPNALLLAVHLANRTSRLKIGCGFNIAPIWHPLRLAEDFAVADIVTRGHVRLGVGRGYHVREVETLNGPLLDQEANRELFEEQVEILLKALREPSFAHAGKHYTLPPALSYRGYVLEDITLVPRPTHAPIECWQPIVSGNPRGLSFMARNGLKGFLGGSTALGGGKTSVVHAWREQLAQHGRETQLGGDLIIGFNVFIADTEEEAIRRITPHVEEYQKMFGPLGFLGSLTPEQLTRLGNPSTAASAGLPSVRDLVRSGAWIVGPPDRIALRLSEIQELYPGLEEVMVGHAIGTPARVISEQLTWFAAEVMPAVWRRTPPVETVAVPHAQA
jgi:alkanesulfonate monooxygenase SsuD/methylene tetrahydromethanopterin reductase-like flavin-dependent oxidoreductase (luciferase family)